MPVRYTPPAPADLLPVPGVRLGTAVAKIKRWERDDLLVAAFDAGTVAAGVFTRNRFCAAPVIVCRRHLEGEGRVRALVVNAGNANAGTGDAGIAAAEATCAAVASMLGCTAREVLPFSTGVIMEPLPVEKIVAALPAARNALAGDHWFAAVSAIMTTDTVPKAFSTRIRISTGEVTVTGIAKGAGMIRPNMATMLGFVATDASVPKKDLQGMLSRVVDRSFNCVTVDGDTSTNDSFILAATGAGPSARNRKDLALLEEAIAGVSGQLAQAIVRDGEGATKFVTVRVERGRSDAECRSIAYSIAHSPLVKTAFFASDPNLGRILAAIGNAGVALDTGKVDLYIDEVLVAKRGGRNPAYREEAAIAAMKKPEFTVRALLNRGKAEATVWTCDFSFDYVKINAEYRT